MDAIKYLRQRNKMCNHFKEEDTTSGCMQCPLFPGCSLKEYVAPEKAVSAVEQWVTENSEKKPDPIKQTALRIGTPAVLEMTAEECAELIEVLAKELGEITRKPGPGLRIYLAGKISEELADVGICLDMLSDVGYRGSIEVGDTKKDATQISILDTIKACASLAHACLKEARRLRGDNPTPKTANECKEEIEGCILKVTYEIACLSQFGYRAEKNIREVKIRRMTERLGGMD